MIGRWNRVVRKEDMVFVLGDVSWRGKEETEKIIRNLRGRKILIKGNHDKRSNSWYKEIGFEEVYSYPILYKGFFLLSHEPIEFLNNHIPMVNIYGHVHNDERFKDFCETGACVSVERINYTPILFDEVARKITEIAMAE